MLFYFGLKSFVLTFFFCNGILFSILLFLKAARQDDKSAYWLAAFTFLSALYISPFMLGYGGWYSTQPYRNFLFYMPLQQLFLLPPVLYFYCRSLFDRSFIFQRHHLIHFIPAAGHLFYSLLIFINDQVLSMGYFFYADGKDKDFSDWYQVSGFLLLGYYLFRCLRLYRRYKVLTFDTVSYADVLTFRWAKRFLASFALLLLARLLFFILNPEWVSFGQKFWYYVVFSILYYYIALSGLLNIQRSMVSLNQEPQLPVVEEASAMPLAEAAAPEATGKLALPHLEEWKLRIQQLIEEERLYENPTLTVQQVADKLHTHSKKVSQVINQGFDSNFNDYINRLRVEALLKQLQSGAQSTQTLLGLAYGCGFNSKSTFNRAFKRVAGMTPKDYCKKQDETRVIS